MGTTQSKILSLLRSYGAMSFLSICEILKKDIDYMSAPKARAKKSIIRLIEEDLVGFDGFYYKVKSVKENKKVHYQWDF